MRYAPETRAAIVRHRVRIFKLTIGRETHGVMMASMLVIAQDKIIDLLRKNRTAFCAHILRNGTVQIRTRFEDDKGFTDSQRRTFRKYGTFDGS